MHRAIKFSKRRCQRRTYNLVPYPFAADSTQTIRMTYLCVVLGGPKRDTHRLARIGFFFEDPSHRHSTRLLLVECFAFSDPAEDVINAMSNFETRAHREHHIFHVSLLEHKEDEPHACLSRHLSCARKGKPAIEFSKLILVFVRRRQ